MLLRPCTCSDSTRQRQRRLATLFSHTTLLSLKSQAILNLDTIFTVTWGPCNPFAQLPAKLLLIFCKSSPLKHHVRRGLTWAQVRQLWSSMCILGMLANKAMPSSLKWLPSCKCSWHRAKENSLNWLAWGSGNASSACISFINFSMAMLTLRKVWTLRWTSTSLCVKCSRKQSKVKVLQAQIFAQPFPSTLAHPSCDQSG